MKLKSANNDGQQTKGLQNHLQFCFFYVSKDSKMLVMNVLVSLTLRYQITAGSPIFNITKLIR